jgi:hypothetical protein
MYGLILQGIAVFIQNKYGAKVWQEILYVSGVEETTFQVCVVRLDGWAN